MKLNLGCGHLVLNGYVNLDKVQLPGIDVVHDLAIRPWPFKDSEFDEIILTHVLEHLDSTVKTMDELWRICVPTGVVKLAVPYWNSADFVTDPTHTKPFNEHTFDFFDPDHLRCMARPYYSKARFKTIKKTYHVKAGESYFPVKSKFLQYCLEMASHFLCNIIQVMEIELECIK